MLISLSKSVPGQPRHVVLVCEQDEVSDAGYVVATVLDKQAKPVRKTVRRAGNTRFHYLFHMRYLDQLLLAFPLAAKSTGLQRRLDRINAESISDRMVEPFDIPGLWDNKNECEAQPFDHQYLAIAECVRFLCGDMDAATEQNFVESFLENDEMGLGKTLIAQSAISIMSERLKSERPKRKRGLKVLVVTPKNGKFVWERENARWFGFDLQVVDADKQDMGARNAAIKRRAMLTVINPEMLRDERKLKRGTEDEYEFIPKHPDLFNYKYDLVVIDEYHRFGTPTSQQSQGLLQLDAERYLPMSGTPYLNRPTQLWVILNRCWPEVYPDYETFKVAIEVLNHKGKVIGSNPKFTAGLKKFMGHRSLRRRKDQVLAGLPPVLPIDLPIELNREQQRIYNRIRNELIIVLDSGEEKMMHARSLVMRLKQACFSPELFGGSKHSSKIDELHESVESLIQSGEKALIGSEWAKATRILQREFVKYNPAYVDGSVTGDKRMAEADRFNNDPDCHLYIGTIGANREAVTLSAATTVIFTDKDWSPLVNAQFVGRSAGGGLRGLESGVDHVSVISMFARGTYEEAVEELLAFKQANFTAIIDNDGGIAVEKSIITSLRDLI